MRRWQIVALLLAVALLTAMAATPALAAKGGNGGGKGGGKGGGPSTSTEATLSVAPDPVSAGGAAYWVTGAGFKPNAGVNITLSEPTCCRFFTDLADADGKILFRSTTGEPGTYKIEAYQRLNGKKLTLMATASLSVVEP